MAASFILVSRFPIEHDALTTLRARLVDDHSIRFLVDLEQQELLQLRAYSDLAAFTAEAAELEGDWERFSGYLTGDVRRELLRYVEAPKDIDAPLPQTDYLQLRHIEVPPQRMQAYRQWREATIFEVVRAHDEVEAFLAYHSLISGQPGVMFLAGFSGDPLAYQQVFSSARYQTIVREAGNSYIAGGREGLYTRIYARPQVLAA